MKPMDFLDLISPMTRTRTKEDKSIRENHSTGFTVYIHPEVDGAHVPLAPVCISGNLYTRYLSLERKLR